MNGLASLQRQGAIGIRVRVNRSVLVYVEYREFVMMLRVKGYILCFVNILSHTRCYLLIPVSASVCVCVCVGAVDKAKWGMAEFITHARVAETVESGVLSPSPFFIFIFYFFYFFLPACAQGHDRSASLTAGALAAIPSASEPGRESSKGVGESVVFSCIPWTL